MTWHIFVKLLASRRFWYQFGGGTPLDEGGGGCSEHKGSRCEITLASGSDVSVRLACERSQDWCPVGRISFFPPPSPFFTSTPTMHIIVQLKGKKKLALFSCKTLCLCVYILQSGSQRMPVYCTELKTDAFLFQSQNHASQKAELRENDCSCWVANSKNINMSLLLNNESCLSDGRA